MRRRPTRAVYAFVPLDPTGSTPLYRQLYDGLRTAILSGRLEAGARLPSSRALADDFNVSRTTVCLALDQLRAEGYIAARRGSGTYVASALPEELLRVRAVAAARPALPGSGGSLSERGRAIASTTVTTLMLHSGPARAFRVGGDPECFPRALWGKLMTRRWRRPPRGMFGNGPPAGYRPLRVAVAEYLKSARGVRCEADQVLIVNGSQQALDIAARILLDPNDVAWIEDPGYLGDRAALIAAGARYVGVPVDREGIIVEEGVRLAPQARLAFVTPSHQYPLGMTMSLGRRFALLEWARRAGAWIIEDDYDSEYRYCGRPLAALQGLDNDGRVIYTGSFSKVLLPSLRLGYVVVPPDLVDGFARARAASDRHSPTLEQVVLTDFITEGHFARHIRRTRTLYATRRKALIAAAEEQLGGVLDLEAPEAGMQGVGWLRRGWNDREVATAALGEGIEAPAVSDLFLRPPERGGLVLGFASVNENALVAGMRVLARVLERMPRSSERSGSQARAAVEARQF